VEPNRKLDEAVIRMSTASYRRSAYYHLVSKLKTILPQAGLGSDTGHRLHTVRSPEYLLARWE
jgi:hypothetical protein